MAFTPDLRAAAHRHLDAANKLFREEAKRGDVAGYLFGIAAECAVKEIATSIACARTDEILYAHFPELRRLLLDRLQGRTAQKLRRLIEHDGFLNQWHVKMRYAPKDDLKALPVEDWAKQAAYAVNEMGT